MGQRAWEEGTQDPDPGSNGTGVVIGFLFYCLSTVSFSQSATLDLKSKEEKDAELDKRIEALRRKNEALIRRYQVP